MIHTDITTCIYNLSYTVFAGSDWFFPRSPAPPPSPGTRSSLFSSSTASSTSSSKSLSLDQPPEPSPPPLQQIARRSAGPPPKLTPGLVR
jgi:hypothetical protein